MAQTAVKSTILIADDEPNIRRVFEALFTKEGYNVLTAENGKRALALAAANNIDVLLTDLIMPDITGVEVLQQVKAMHPNCAAIIVTAYGTIKSAVEAMRYGAFHYLQKPFDMDEVRVTIKRALDAQAHPSPSAPAAPSRKPLARRDALDCVSPKMQDIYHIIERVADSRATVLLHGETGTGKERIAHALHDNSPRAGKPFVAVSCAALPETLLESELFGHEKNAFTGAAVAKPGRFELANGGTLFLDEIGDIPLTTQIKLLRVVQEWEFERIGAVKSTKVDVRLIAATNKDLEKCVREGTFRSDLYYRLNIVSITLPPLRERPEDIPALAAHFLDKYSRQNSRKITNIAPNALACLCAYRWTGNVRELENVIERGIVLADRDAHTLTADLLPHALSALLPEAPASAQP